MIITNIIIHAIDEVKEENGALDLNRVQISNELVTFLETGGGDGWEERKMFLKQLNIELDKLYLLHDCPFQKTQIGPRILQLSGPQINYRKMDHLTALGLGVVELTKCCC